MRGKTEVNVPVT